MAEQDAVTLTAPVALGSTVYPLTGMYGRVGVDVDAEGMPVIGDKSSLSISLSALMTAGLADPDDLKKPGWTASMLDALGVTFTGRLESVMLDRTLGVATFILKRNS